jgi:hypothetical protein
MWRKITKDIVDSMHTLKIVMQKFTSKNNIFKTNKRCAMYDVSIEKKVVL